MLAWFWVDVLCNLPIVFIWKTSFRLALISHVYKVRWNLLSFSIKLIILVNKLEKLASFLVNSNLGEIVRYQNLLWNIFNMEQYIYISKFYKCFVINLLKWNYSFEGSAGVLGSSCRKLRRCFISVLPLFWRML